MSIMLPCGYFRGEPVEGIGSGGLGCVATIPIAPIKLPGKLGGTAWARKRLNSSRDANRTIGLQFEREVATLKSLAHPGIVSFQGERVSGAELPYHLPLYIASARKDQPNGHEK